MKLTIKEKEIVEEFKRRIEEKFPGEILEVLIFGSYARGDAANESDIDILVVTKSDNWQKGDEIRETGYGLDEEIDYKLSIQTVSKAHNDFLKQNNFQFAKNVEREGITV